MAASQIGLAMVKNPTSTPLYVLSTNRDASIDALLRTEVVSANVAPASTAGVVFRGERSWQLSLGCAGHLDAAHQVPADEQTYYDLASLTKPVTALCALYTAEAGMWRLDEPLSRYLTGLRDTWAGRMPLELLLAHRAGLEAHLELFAPLLRGECVDVEKAQYAAAQARRIECDGITPTEGFPPVYSDLGYLLVGYALEEVWRERLDDVLVEVLAKFGVRGFGSAHQLANSPRFAQAVAPTEELPYRGGVVRGRVHDDNAWALAGFGCCGHAGLFATLPAVATLCRCLLECAGGRATQLRPDAFRVLLRHRPGGSLLAGFDSKSMGASSAGERASCHTFGHLGYTGTSFWCDPVTEIGVVLLTNRVHPTRDNIGIRGARPRVHDHLFGIGGAP